MLRLPPDRQVCIFCGEPIPTWPLDKGQRVVSSTSGVPNTQVVFVCGREVHRCRLAAQPSVHSDVRR